MKQFRLILALITASALASPFAIACDGKKEAKQMKAEVQQPAEVKQQQTAAAPQDQSAAPSTEKKVDKPTAKTAS